MTTEENKQIIRRYIDELNLRHVAILDELVASEFRETVRQGYHRNTTAFPDYFVEILDLLAEGDQVVLEWTHRGVHLGVYDGIPPTGKTITGSAISIYQVREGKIVAARGESDRVEIWQQLGVIPNTETILKAGQASMERADWIQEKREAARDRMDNEWAPIYDENWGEIDPTHQRFFEHFLSLCPPQALILDAACGTGKYWPIILDSGRRVFGIDQSQGMLSRARGKFPAVPVEKTGLQEMTHIDAFDAAVCMDAMENIFPEDWLPVLRNLHRAIKPGGMLYFTVELLPEQELEGAFEAAQGAGLPILYGEWAPEGRYHYYPKITLVKAWLAQAGFRLIDETNGEDYHHFLIKKA
jgi:predicted ester cyclase/SAM-dependent methyltransferase